jgi:hypothetical protein
MKHHNVVTRAFILIRRWQFEDGKKRFLHQTTRISGGDTIDADLTAIVRATTNLIFGASSSPWHNVTTAVPQTVMLWSWCHVYAS